MNLLRQPAAWLRTLVESWLDLVLLFWALAVLQAVLPGGHTLQRPDLAPWATLSLSAAAALRARALGEGPHPSLRVRRAADGLLRRIVAGGLPWVLLGWFEAGRTQSLPMAGAALVGGTFLGLVRARSGQEQRTGWNPDPRGDRLIETLTVVLGVALALGLGRWSRLWASNPVLAALGPSGLVGLGFLFTGAAAGRLQNLRQRLRAGRRDGRRYTPGLFRPLLAIAGPGLGLWALLWLTGSLDPSADFGEGALLVALHVAAWAAVLWPEPEPVAVACLLHEVVPVGGGDDRTGAGFDRPPEGALRLTPQAIRRTRAQHAWLVPVQKARIGEFDDPVRPLWPSGAPAQPSHVLGEARFELDATTGRAQTRQVTLRLRDHQDLSAMAGGELQVRRIFVLHPAPDASGAARVDRTYRWEEAVAPGSLQAVDATTRELYLTDGSILVLSSEGVARAWELEIGRPLVREELPTEFRAPQIEDYTAP